MLIILSIQENGLELFRVHQDRQSSTKLFAALHYLAGATRMNKRLHLFTRFSEDNCSSAREETCLTSPVNLLSTYFTNPFLRHIFEYFPRTVSILSHFSTFIRFKRRETRPTAESEETLTASDALKRCHCAAWLWIVQDPERFSNQ